MKINTGNQTYDVSLAKEFQQHLTKEYRKNGVSDQGKYKKKFTEGKWANRQYHAQDNADVSYQYVTMYCNTNKFTKLPFFGPH